MRMDKLTSRFQQALADAQSLAVGRDHNMIEPVHLMTALLAQQGGGTAPLLTQAGVNVPVLRTCQRGIGSPAQGQRAGGQRQCQQ